jgi:UDP-N-acetylmuramate: L-alanyl-gamma-D-glutamyl-meso-diaminopimelate ligase
MHIHLIGVAGTGMGALAGLLKAAGHRVTGSDTAFYPPMGDALRAWGVETRQGFSAQHLSERPDLVVVGNVCRKDNPEARAAIDGGLRYTSMPGLIEELFVTERPGFVIAGTHGKTTTTALVAWLLQANGKAPGFLVGGIPKNFGESFALGGAGAPFVVEGDEYDSAFFEKSPKFWRYRPWAAVLTSVEQDHIDIYPTMESYRDAFRGFVARIPKDGVLAAFTGDAEVRALAEDATCRVRTYALSTDAAGPQAPMWMAAPATATAGTVPFDLYIGGTSAGRAASPLAGAHNLRNVLGALAIVTEGAGVELRDALGALAEFQGVRRRQDLLAVADGVRIYDDFAHHPTAVYETLLALRQKHPEGKLIAIFEPRSATASRKLHEAEYPAAFAPANEAILAPVGRAEIPEAERLSVTVIGKEIETRGGVAFTPVGVDAIVDLVAERASPGDTVVLMSNGGFGNIYEKLPARLVTRAIQRRNEQR